MLFAPVAIAALASLPAAAIGMAGKAGRKAGTINYRKEEVELLLDLIEHFQPTGPSEWEQVTEEYNNATTEERNGGDTTRNRDTKALKHKFKKLVMKHNVTTAPRDW